MPRVRKVTPVTLTWIQRKLLERLWFYYGHHGRRATPANHSFIQGLLEHGHDRRPLLIKRSPKKERPTLECETTIDAVLNGEIGVSEDDNILQANNRLTAWLNRSDRTQEDMKNTT